MDYYEIKVNESFIQSYKFHIQSISKSFTSYSARLVNMVRKKIKIIQLFPFSTSILKFPKDNNIYRKVIIDRRYHLIYTVKDKTVFLLYFSDGRQSPEMYFKLLDIFKSLN